MVRTRFAPSPTGYLHVGGARTALFNWLFARHHGGRFILRVEDTDAARNTPEANAAIFDGLRWLGLDWDEGPDIGGGYGPYRQSERASIHDQWFERLRESGRVYEDDGTWRFAFERRPITIQDLIAGEVTMDYSNTANTPDMVVRRRDGSYIFHFVNVVDDLEMGVTHVIRGDDHLANTHKHWQLSKAFGVEPPAYAHVPLILNADGTKMSKRSEGASVASYRQDGFLPDAVVNFLALLGWSPKDDNELFSREELVRRFELDGITRSAATFNLEKCRWFNAQYLRRLSGGELTTLALPFLEAAKVPSPAPESSAMIFDLLKEKVRTLNELPPLAALFTRDDLLPQADAREKAAADPQFANTAKQLLADLAALNEAEWTPESLANIPAQAAAELGIKPGKAMFTLRLISTGRTGGPDLAALLSSIGRERALSRLPQIRDHLLAPS